MNTDEIKCTLLKPENMTIYEALEIKALFSKSLVEFDQIEVDLANVSEIDSAGLQLMVALKNDAIKQKKTMLFSAHSHAVISFLELFDMNQFFGDPVILSK